MYRKLPGSSGDTLAYALEVELTEEDVEKLQAELSVAMEQQGPLRVLIEVDGLEDIEPAAIWQDLKMTPDYVRGIERFAVVGDERWHAWLARASDTFADAEHFAPEDIDRAWEWLERSATSRTGSA